MVVKHTAWRRQTYATPMALTSPAAFNHDMGFLYPPGALSATLLRTRASATFGVAAASTGGSIMGGWELGTSAGVILFVHEGVTPPLPGVLNPWFSDFTGIDLLAMTTLTQGAKWSYTTEPAETATWGLPGDMIDSRAQRKLDAGSRIMMGMHVYAPGIPIGQDDGLAEYLWTCRLNLACLVTWTTAT